jgi:polyphosphate kinase
MRREYDFSKGTRGKHAGKRLRIVGDTRTDKGQSAAARIQQVIERDLKSREVFKVVWRELDQAEREKIRAAWLKKISTVLIDQLSPPSRRT